MYAVGEMMVGGPFSNILAWIKNVRPGILAEMVTIVENKDLPFADSASPGLHSMP